MVGQIFQVTLRPAAAKFFRQLRDHKLETRLLEALQELRQNPTHIKTRKLSGYENRYRVRVGDYRIIYQIHNHELIVLVLAIGHRREIYR